VALIANTAAARLKFIRGRILGGHNDIAFVLVAMWRERSQMINIRLSSSGGDVFDWYQEVLARKCCIS
jgi:hypothetical protein